MTNPNLTEIVVILDRSGSMNSIKDDMIGGFNTFMEDQRKIPDPCVVTFYQFNAELEKMFEEVAIKDVRPISMAPMGGTALYDACCFVINQVGERLAKKPPEERPGKVIVVIITDGANNASIHFNQAKTAELIKRQTEEWKWQFLFLGANIDAKEVASGIGISPVRARGYEISEQGVRDMYKSTSDVVGNYRTSRGGDVDFSAEPKDKP